MALDVKIQQKIQAYRQSNPKVKLSDEQILSILVKNGDVVLTEDQKRSLFANDSKQNNNTGLKLEKTAKKPNPEKTIYLQSGRKVVYSRLADGRTVMKYFGTDGSRLDNDYFKKVEGQISISADGNSYTVTKNGKKQTFKAKNPTQGAIDQNIAKLNNQEKALNKAKKKQGWIGKGWDWFKNATGVGDGSDKAQQQIDAERKLLNQIKTGKVNKKDFKEVTGLDYTKENLEKFKRGELSQAETKINGYKEGQDMATDVAGDVAAGFVAMGAVAAAPFTGGASLTLAFGAGAATKMFINSLESATGEKKYNPFSKEGIIDFVVGGVNGLLAPVTGGCGAAVAKGVVTKLLSSTAKQGIKTATAFVTEQAVIGGIFGGGVEGSKELTTQIYDAIADDKEIDMGEVGSKTLESTIGGAIAGPLMSAGFKAIGNVIGKTLGRIFRRKWNNVTNTETKVEIPENTKSKQPQVNNNEVKPKTATASETPIQIQQRLIKELKTAKSREDFSRITQEMKNLPKTEEYQAVRQRLGGEYFQRYNEWKANLPESIRVIKNMATDENGGIINLDKDINIEVLRLTKGDINKFKNILLKYPNYSKEYLLNIMKLKNSDGKFICENLLDLDLYLNAYDNNPSFAQKLLILKKENGDYKYNAQDIEWFIDSKNLEVKNLLKDSYGTNYNEVIGNQLEQLVKNDNDKFVLLKLLIDNDKYTIEEIMDIIPYANNDNFEVIINNKGLEPKLFIDTLVEKDVQSVDNMAGNIFNQLERKEIKNILLKNPAKLKDLVEMVKTKNSTTTEIIKNIKSNDFQINKNVQQVQAELKKIGISDDEIAGLDLESPMFQLVNQRNVERLQKLTGSEELEKIVALLSSSDSKVILDKLYLFEEQNVKLDLDDIMNCVYAPESITKITTEQIKAYKKLSDSLDVGFNISNCAEIQNPKNITNEFVNAFSEKYKKLQQYGVNLDLNVDPQIIFNSIDDTLINDLKMATELGLLFKTSKESKDSLVQAISSFKGKEYKNGSLEKFYNMEQRDKDIIKELLCMKNKYGYQRFTIADIDSIMANHAGMLNTFLRLSKQETNHEYRFNNEQLAQLMQFRHYDDIMDALINDTAVINGCTTYKYSSSEIESILAKRRQFPAFEYERFLDKLLQKEYAGKSINKIFDFILSDNKHFDIVKSLDEFCLESKGFDLSNIIELIREKEYEKQLNNLLKVAFDKKIRFDIESITLFIKNKNNKITDKILNDYPRFSLDEMKEFLRTARQGSLEEYYIFNTNLDAKTINAYCNYIYEKHLSDNTMIKNIIQSGKNPIEFGQTMPKLLWQFKAKNKYQERMVYDLIEKGKNQQEIMYIANIIKTQDDYNKVVSLMKNNNDTWQIIRILNGQSPYKKFNVDLRGYPQTLAEISKIIDTDGKVSYESKILMELKETNPSRYKKIIDSGLLDLIKEKRVSRNIVCSSDKYGRILSDNVLNDIIKIKNNDPLVTTIKNSKEFNDISKYVRNGDVCEYNGRLFANDNGKPVELKLTKEKFEELFPLLSTNMASQGYIGDCWLVSTLFGCIDKPKSRIELYKLFEQDGNDILIKFPNQKSPIRFPNGDPKVNSDNPFVKGVSSYGAKPPIGLQLLEKAFTVNRSIEFKDKILSNMSNLADENALMKSILEGGSHPEALDGLFSENTVTFERYSMQDPQSSVSKILNILQHTAEDDYILYFDTPSKGFSDTKHVKNYDMCYKHAHCIKAFNGNTGTVYITNPHEGGTISKVPFFEFISDIEGITLVKFK